MTTAVDPSQWSSPLLSKLLHNVKYYYYDVWNIYGDPRVTSYPLMDGGPWGTLAMICFYLYVVKYWGPSMMKSRPPYDMRNLILLYNVSLVLVNGWLFIKGTWITNFGLDSWKCQAVDRNSTSQIDLYKIKLGWLFYMTKTVDFCDTFFFVLRKKDRQISALHVFHHSCMPFFCWIGLKFTPGGNNAFFPWLNSGVHTVMYAYYALSTFPELRPYLWWKKYITQMQMIQFVAVIAHSFYSMLSPGCQWPKMFIYLSIFNAFIFFCMFYSFFQKTYSQKSAADDRHQRRYSCMSESTSPASTDPPPVYNQLYGDSKNGLKGERPQKGSHFINPFKDGQLFNIFQVCKPDHVNYNDDIIYCSTATDNVVHKSASSSSSPSARKADGREEKRILAGDQRNSSSSHSHHHHSISNVCNSSSSSSTTTLTTCRSLCGNPKCVKKCK